MRALGWQAVEIIGDDLGTSAAIAAARREGFERDVDVNNLPPSIRQQLILDGAQNISAAPYIDRSAPTTAAFLSGPQGANGWYTGPVTVTLLATDIDGSSDIAATSYTLDGGSVVAYAAGATKVDALRARGNCGSSWSIGNVGGP